jgi:Ras-related protein Rab-1A
MLKFLSDRGGQSSRDILYQKRSTLPDIRNINPKFIQDLYDLFLKMKSFENNFNEYDYLFKFVLLGSSGVGKTSMIVRYADNKYNEAYSATIGLDFKIKTVKVEGKTVKLQIWDTAGQERYNSLSSVYYKGSHGCIAVYDITNPDSLEVAKKHLSKCYTDYGFPMGCALLVGNKLDLEETRKVNR